MIGLKIGTVMSQPDILRLGDESKTHLFLIHFSGMFLTV